MLVLLALLPLASPAPFAASPSWAPARAQSTRSPSRTDLRKAVRRLRGKKASTRERAIEVLVAGGGESIPHLIEGHALGPKGSRDHRPLIRDVLLRITLTSPDALVPLGSHLASADVGVAQAARTAFLLAPAEDAVPALIERAAQGTPEERLVALRLLGRHRSGAAPAEEVLVETISNGDDAALRKAAGLAAARAGRRTPAVIAALEERVRDPEDHPWAMTVATAMGPEGARILLAGMDIPSTSHTAATSVAVLLEQSEEDAAEALSALIAGAAAEDASRERRARTLLILYLASEFLDVPAEGLEFALAQAADSAPAVRARAYPAAAALGGADERVVEALAKGLREEVEAEYEPLEALLGAIASLGADAPSLGAPMLEAWAEMPTARDSLMEAFGSAIAANGCVERDPKECLEALAEIALECRYGARAGFESLLAISVPMRARPVEGCAAMVDAIDRCDENDKRMGLTMALDEFGEDAVESLYGLLGDRSYDVGMTAVCGLCRLGKTDQRVEEFFRAYWQYDGLRFNLALALTKCGPGLESIKMELFEGLDGWSNLVHRSIMLSVQDLVESRGLAPRLGKYARDPLNEPGARAAALFALRQAPKETEGLEELVLDGMEESLGKLTPASADAFGPLDPESPPPGAADEILRIGVGTLASHGLTTPAVVEALEQILGSDDAAAIRVVANLVAWRPAIAPAAKGMIPSLLERRSPVDRRSGLKIARHTQELADESLDALAELMEEDHVELALGAAALLARRAAPLDERATVAMLLAVERSGVDSVDLTRAPREGEEAKRSRPLRLARKPPVEEADLETILDHLAASIGRHPRVGPAAERVLDRWRASVDPALRALAGDIASRMKN